MCSGKNLFCSTEVVEWILSSSFLIFAGRPGNSVIGVHFLRLLMNMVFSSSTTRFRVGPLFWGVASALF
jgi:hypothetical protein